MTGDESSAEAAVVGKGGEKGAAGRAGASTCCPLEGPGITGLDTSGVWVGTGRVTPQPPHQLGASLVRCTEL